MKILFDKTMEIITPCFCAGANQAKAEIRAPSIRGELRWWFRALGGTREQEADVFGSVQPKAQASKLLVRVSNGSKTANESSSLPANHRFFVKSRLDLGADSFIPAGRTFRLQMLRKQEVSCSELLNLAVRCFTELGALGLRSNRGLGAVQPVDGTVDLPALEAALKAREIDLFRLAPQQSALDALVYLEEQVKTFREQKGIPKGSDNAMGFVDGSKRHASCLRVRPVRLPDGKFLPVMIYSEAGMGVRITSIRPQLRSFFA
jgi:CRISPR type III-B/RAMP module RAMP protein Cmr1